MEAKNIIQKKRINSKEKNYLAHTIIDRSLAMIRTEGQFVEINNIDTKPMGVIKGKIELMLTTPFNKIPDVNYLLDIWHMGHGKVFSVHWADLEAIDIVSFKRGDWINNLLQ